jgi:hypothetical protein
MKIAIRLLPVAALVALGVAFAVLRPGSATSQGTGNNVLKHALAIEQGRVQRNPHEALLSSGVMYALVQASEARGQGSAAAPAPAAAAAVSAASSTGTQGCQNTFTGAPNNIRVNQDCSLRRQAEEVIAVNPNNPQNLVAGQNDSRIGFNHCGYDWSFDGGHTWGDQLPPFWQFILGDGHTADVCSDPTATFDADGNAYVGGIVFDINSAANAFVTAKSNAPIGGQFYHSPLVQSFQTYRDVPLGVVANDNNPNIFHDKEFIVADAGATSPKENNVYATWTRFNAATGSGVGGDSPIYFSQSTNGGATWSPGIEISGAAAVCTFASGSTNANACDQDQGSDPIVGPDGTIYVSFFNGNTPRVGINQQLIVKCPATANCAAQSSWTAPVKITDDIGTQPIGPDPTTGCPAGRQCLPPNGYRVQDETTGSISVDSNGKLYFAWADFRNGGGTCNWQNAKPGRAATASPPCDNDVFYAFSTNGGATWSSPIDVTPQSTFGANAQWQPWSDVVANGNHLFIAYYDRHYGSCESTGCNDITLADVSAPASGSQTIAYKRVTTSSMPNLVPANNPVQAGFLGDYIWVNADTGSPKVVWADTRGLGGAVEEDAYYATP